MEGMDKIPVIDCGSIDGGGGGGGCTSRWGLSFDSISTTSVDNKDEIRNEQRRLNPPPTPVDPYHIFLFLLFLSISHTWMPRVCMTCTGVLCLYRKHLPVELLSMGASRVGPFLLHTQG
jgi:hypothetical protein